MGQSYEEIKENVDTKAIISSVVKLRDSGRYLVGLCPFHEDSRPSFAYYPSDERWVCFSCGVRGDIFDFYSRYYGISASESARRLACDGAAVPASRSLLDAEREWVTAAINLCNAWGKIYTAQARKVAIRRAGDPSGREIYSKIRKTQRGDMAALAEKIEKESKFTRRSRQVARLASATSILSRDYSPFIFGSRSFKETCAKIASMY